MFYHLESIRHAERFELSNAFRNILDSGAYSDMKIRLSDGTEINCHRVVMSERCSFFENALTSGFKETHTGIIEMFNDPPEAVRAMVNYLYTATYPKHGLNGPDLVLFHLDVYIIATTYLVEGLARIAKNSLAQELDNTPEVLPDVTNALRECNFRFRTFPKMRGLYRGIKKWAIEKFEDTYDDNTWKVMAKESPGFIQDVTKEAWRQWERSCTREAAIWLEHFEGPDSTGRVRVDNAECPGGCEYIQDRLILSTKGVAKQECVHCGKLYTSAEWFANSVLSISEYPESETTDDGSDSFDIWGEDAVDYSDGEEDSESD